MFEKPDVPEYKIVYKEDSVFSNEIDHYEYDGEIFYPCDIIDFDANSYYLSIWHKKHPNEEYPYRIPGTKDYFIMTIPRGDCDASIHTARESIEKELTWLQEHVNAAHPLTVRSVFNRSHNICEDDEILDYYCDPFEYEGWESVDDAKILLVKTSKRRMPIYAIALPEPVGLRPPNYDALVLEKLSRDLQEIEYCSDGLDERLEKYLDATGIGSSFDAVHELAEQVLSLIEDKLQEERTIGRKPIVHVKEVPWTHVDPNCTTFTLNRTEASSSE